RPTRDTLAIGRPAASDEDMWKAVADLGLTERFAAFPGGLDATVREQGSNLSAGERRGAPPAPPPPPPRWVPVGRPPWADPSVVGLDGARWSLDPGTEVTVE